MVVSLLGMAVAVGGLAGCFGSGDGGNGDGVESVTVFQLWRSAEALDGRPVRTEGTVRVFLAGTPDEHYALEDADQHRVGIANVPRHRLAALVGTEVVVEGTARFTPERGVAVEVTTLTVTGAPSS
jgi:hypothetical protein